MVAGERFAEQLQVHTFKSVLRQEIAWFDKPENSLGALINMLTADPTEINKVSVN